MLGYISNVSSSINVAVPSVLFILFCDRKFSWMLWNTVSVGFAKPEDFKRVHLLSQPPPPFFFFFGRSAAAFFFLFSSQYFCVTVRSLLKKENQVRERESHTSAGYRVFNTRCAHTSSSGKSPSSLWFPWQLWGGLYRLHLRIGKVNLHASGRPPASQMKEHFEWLPGLEEERGCQACLMLAVCTWQDLPFPRIPHSGSPPAT